MPDFEPLPFIEMRTSSHAVNRAYRVAMGDLIGNTRVFQDGLLDAPRPVILAGLDYDTPWTRDAAINVWNGLGLIWPETAKNTLLAVLEKDAAGNICIGGQYWDAIIWALGAWAYYLYTGERDFLALAYKAVANSLERFLREEFDPGVGLFRGPAVYGDGVAAYPDRYSPGGTSSILAWVEANPEKKAPAGYGIPMMALSTNCVYARALQIAGEMARELGQEPDPSHAALAELVRAAIREHFWDSQSGAFRYLVDPWGGDGAQEGLGHAFALLFGIADPEQSRSVLDRQHITPAGIPCVWPSYTRYTALGGYGRHSGTVWPFISGFWGEAALLRGRADLFEREFASLTGHINRDAQCAEIYHPETGEIYGGLQEQGRGPSGMEWISCARQSWTASAYLRMILTGLAGMRFETGGVRFAPYLPQGVERLEIQGLPYHGRLIDVLVEGRGGKIAAARVDGAAGEAFIPAEGSGPRAVEIRVEA